MLEVDTDELPEEGKSKVLQCETGVTVNTVWWYKDGVPLDKAKQDKYIFMEDELELDITKLNINDSGAYQCVVNSNSKPNSNDHKTFKMNVRCKYILI